MTEADETEEKEREIFKSTLYENKGIWKVIEERKHNKIIKEQLLVVWEVKSIIRLD